MAAEEVISPWSLGHNGQNSVLNPSLADSSFQMVPLSLLHSSDSVLCQRVILYPEVGPLQPSGHVASGQGSAPPPSLPALPPAETLSPSSCANIRGSQGLHPEGLPRSSLSSPQARSHSKLEMSKSQTPLSRLTGSADRLCSWVLFRVRPSPAQAQPWGL